MLHRRLVDFVGKNNSLASNAVSHLTKVILLRQSALEYRLLSLGITACANVVHWFASSDIAVGKCVFPYFFERVGFRVQGWYYSLARHLANRQYDVAKVLENSGYRFSFFGKWVSHFPFPKFR